MKTYLVTYTLTHDYDDLPIDDRQTYHHELLANSEEHAVKVFSEEVDYDMAYIGIMGIEEQGTHDNTHAYTVEKEDFPEESEDRDFVTSALPAYVEDRRDIFAHYHKARDFFALATSLLD